MLTRVLPARRGPRRGFVLLEALVASVVLAAALGGALNIIVEGRRQMSNASRRSTASRVLQSLVEQKRNQPYASLSGLGLGAVPGRPDIKREVVVSTVSSTAGGFSYTYKVASVRVYFPYRGNPNFMFKVDLVRTP